MIRAREYLRNAARLLQPEGRVAIGLGALRHWERGDRKPRGAALVLLNVIASEPEVVLRALRRP